MGLAAGIALLEAAIKAITPTYGAQPFVEAPRHTPIEDLSQTSEQRLFTVRPGRVLEITELEGLTREVKIGVEVKRRYRLDPGSDESDRDVAIMAAVDSIKVVQALTRADVVATWAGVIQDVQWVDDGEPYEPLTDPRARIYVQTFIITAFE